MRSDIRRQVAEVLALLGTPTEQHKYATHLEARNGHVCAELTSIFTDIYHPARAEFAAALSDHEALELAHLYGVLTECNSSDCPSIDELLKRPMWRRVIQIASKLQRSFAVDA